MPNMPHAEVTVDLDLLRGLLSDQHSDLADAELRLLSNGWDNEMVRVGDGLLARLPRRVAAAKLVEHEQRWLPELASMLTLPVPAPVRVGLPGRGYPWRWSLIPYLPGVPAALADDLDTAAAATDLGRFLGRLHRPAPENAPGNPVRGIPLAARTTSFAENLALAADRVDTAAARALWADALAAPVWSRPPVWLHGDLHPANLLAEHGRISGVIDFGDITAGDPAGDLAIAWMLLPATDAPAFWSSYADDAGHPVDDALRLRARGWALALGTVFVVHSADNPMMRAIGERTLAAVLG